MESTAWQERLQVIYGPKLSYQLVSDTRGGRTAWSSSVTIGKQTYTARYWYAGTVNAKEDAAEVAMKVLHSTPNSSLASSPASTRRSR